MRLGVVLALLACADGAASGKREAESGETAQAARAAASPVPASSVEFYDARQIAAANGTFGGHSTFHYVESRRAASGSPEIHDRWIDVTIVQAGHATLLSGGQVKGGGVTEPGEHRGGSIVGGTTHSIQTGDLFVVPAGTPHQFQLGQGDSIRYLTIKIANP